jgi:hypothetical protein
VAISETTQLRIGGRSSPAAMAMGMRMIFEITRRGIVMMRATD